MTGVLAVAPSLLSLLAGFLLLLGAARAQTQQTQEQQLAQLCSLYASTGGHGWANSTGWSASCSASSGAVTDSSANPCNRTAVPCNANECPGGDGWRGVTCDSGGDVIGV